MGFYRALSETKALYNLKKNIQYSNTHNYPNQWHINEQVKHKK